MSEVIHNRPVAGKVKLTVLGYLYEFASVPENIRLGYLQKLLKRKNSSSQKNVALLKNIYEHLKDDNMYEWSEEAICCDLGINKNMLYCHKSRLLKDLRTYYFNWKILEKNEFQTSDISTEPEYSVWFQKAMRMYSIGMQREAKNELLKLEKRISFQKKKSKDDKLILVKIYQQLGTHYYTKKKLLRFNHYQKKLERLSSKITATYTGRKADELTSEISLAGTCFKMYKSFFKIKKFSTYTDTIKFYHKILAIARKKNSGTMHMLTILNLGLLHKEIKDYDRSLKYFYKGHAMCLKNRLEKEAIVFRSCALLAEMFSGKINYQNALKKMIDCYENSKRLNVQGYLKEKILFQCLNLCSGGNDKDLYYKFLQEYNSHCILTNGYKSTFSSFYNMKSEFYFQKLKIFRVEKSGSDKIPVVCETDPEYSNKLNRIISEVSQNYKIISTFSSRKQSLMTILMNEYWKGPEMNFEYAKYLVKEIEWLHKSRGKIFENKGLLFESVKLCISITEDLLHLNKKNLLKKYEHKFKELSGNISQYSGDNILTTYSIFSYTSVRSGLKELQNIMTSVYRSLRQKFPGIFKQLLTSLKEKTLSEKNAEVSFSM